MQYAEGHGLGRVSFFNKRPHMCPPGKTNKIITKKFKKTYVIYLDKL